MAAFFHSLFPPPATNILLNNKKESFFRIKFRKTTTTTTTRMNATKMFLFVKSFHRHRNQSGLFSFIVSYPSVSVYAKLKLLVFLCFSEMRARSETKKVRFETMQIFRVCLFKFRWHPFILISFRFVSFFIRPVSISHIPFSDSFSCYVSMKSGGGAHSHSCSYIVGSVCVCLCRYIYRWEQQRGNISVIFERRKME